MTKIFQAAILYAILTLGFQTIQAQIPGFGGSQTPKLTGRITGTVLDSITGTAIDYASVSIRKLGSTSEMGGTLTDSKGNFRLDDIQIGKYELIISFLGYKELAIEVETDGKKPDASLGALVMNPSDILLDEVTIQGEVPLIENKIDRLVYNAEKDISIAGGDASDVLRKVPLLSVDIDGNPSLRGSQNVRVLINGKPSGTMAGNISDALKMIPAEEIKSVEVITSPSAKYDAEGTGGLINIITKKKTAEGTSGTINTGINTRNASLNGSLAKKKGRLSLNSSLGANLFIPQGGSTKFERFDTLPAGIRTFTQNGDFIGGRNTYSGNISADYDINAYNNISSNVRVSNFTFFGDNDVNVVFDDPSIPLLQEYNRAAATRNGTTNIDWSTDYRRTFDNKGQEFSSSFQLTRGISANRYNLEQGADDFPDLILEERSKNTGLNNEITFQVDYVHPFPKGNFETGVKTILRNINSRFTYENRDLISGDFIQDNNRGNTYDYDQNVLASYVSYNHKFNLDWEVKGGLRWEMTDISGAFASGELNVKNQFQNFVPNFTIVRNMKNFRSLKFTYSRRIQRPSIFFLNPFTDESDPRNIRRGNPLLGPEESDQFEIGYNGFFKGVVLNGAVYYRNTRDVIQSYLFIDPSGVSVNSFDNIGYNHNTGVNLFGQLTLFKDLVIRGSFNGFYVVQNGVILGETLRNDDFQYTVFVNATYQFKGGYAIEGFGLFNSQRVTLQGRNPAFSIHNFSFKKDLWNKRGSFGITLTNPFSPFLRFRQDLEGPGFSQTNVNSIPFRAVGVNFSYKFGKIEFRNPMQQRKRGINNQDLKQGEGDMNF